MKHFSGPCSGRVRQAGTRRTVAKLLFKSGPYSGKSVTLPMGKSLTMGRNRDLELPLPDLKLSRRHCQIVFSGERCILKDLGSTNGTTVNGTRLAGEVELNDFDRIILGDTEIEFHYAEKVPLPVNFNTTGADPFGMDEPEQEEIEIASAPEPVAPQQLRAPAAQAANVMPGGEAVRHPSAIAVLDPLAEALNEMCQALPPEPPLMNQPGDAVIEKPRLVFCEGCEGSVPMLDMDLGVAREVDGKIYCKDCLAKQPQAAAPAHAAAMYEGKTQSVPKPAQKPTPKEKSMDDILAALDGEAEVVDTTLKRGSTILNEDETARKMSQIEKMQQQVVPRNAPKPQPAAPAQPAKKDVKEELGEEFEEIG